VRLASQRNSEMNLDRDSCSKWWPECSPEAFKPPPYIATNSWGKSHHRSLSKSQALPSMGINCSI